MIIKPLTLVPEINNVIYVTPLVAEVYKLPGTVYLIDGYKIAAKFEDGRLVKVYPAGNIVRIKK